MTRWVLMLMMVAGCSNMRSAEMQAEMAKANAECTATYPKEIGFFKARADCINQAVSRVAPADANVASIAAYRRFLAGQVDERKITPDEYDARVARYIQETSQKARELHAREMEARARMMAIDPPPGMRSPQLQPANPLGHVLTPRMSIQTNCMRIGDIISCNSY